jgi:hypothetical protein
VGEQFLERSLGDAVAGVGVEIAEQLVQGFLAMTDALSLRRRKTASKQTVRLNQMRIPRIGPDLVHCLLLLVV